MWGRTLEGVTVHLGSLGPIGGEGEWPNGVVTEKEFAEHWTHAAIGAYCPHLEVFGVCVEGSKNVFSRHCVGGDSTTSHCRELPLLCGL